MPAIGNAGERFEFEFTGSTSKVNAEMAAAERRAASLERQARATDRAIDDIGGTSTGAAPKVKGFGDGLDDAGRKAGRAGKGIQGLDSAARDLDRAFSVLKLPAVAAGAVGLTSAAVGAAGGIGALGAALVPVTGAVAALPGLFLAGQQAMGVAKLATAGFGDAIKALDSGNPKKIAEAMEGLGAQAKKTALAVHGLKPEFDGLRVLAQDPIFGAINANFSRLTGLLPIVRQGVSATAGVMGNLINQGARMITSGPWQASFRTVIAANTRMIQAFGEGGLALLDVFRRITVAGLPLAQSFAQLFRNAALAAQGFFASERGARALNNFLGATRSVLIDLGRILSGVAIILINVFRPGVSLGTSMLDTLAKLTAQAARWTQSMQGQERIRAIWADVRNILSTMGPIFLAMAQSAGRFLTVALTLGRWFADLQRAHPALAGIVGNFLTLAAIARFTGISSLVGSVGALVGNVAAIKAFGGVFTGLFGLFARLGGVLAGVWPLLVRLSGVFGLIVGPASKFGAILRFLIPGIGLLASPVGLAVAAIAALAAGIYFLWKRFGSFGAIVAAFQGWISNTLVPAVMRFRDAIMVQWGKAVAYVRSIMPQLQEAVGHVLAVIKVVVGAWVSWMKTVWALLGDDLLRIIKTVWQTIGGVVSGGIRIIQGVIQVVMAAINGDWSRVWGGLGKIVSGAWTIIWSIVKGALGILQHLVGLGLSAIPLLFLSLFSKLTPLVGRGLMALVRLIGELPGMAVRALVRLGPLLGSLITKAWEGFQAISTKMVAAFMGWARQIPGRMVAAIANFGRAIVELVLIPGWNFWRSTFTRLWNAFINWARNFPQWMVNAIRAFGSFIVNRVLIPAWTAWRATSVRLWTAFIGWARTIPQSMYNAIIAIVSRMRTVISSAFSAALTTAKSGWATIRRWATGIPGSMASAIGGLGNRIASVFSSAFSRARNLLASFYNNVVKKVAGFFGVKLPGFAVGGPIADTTQDRRPVARAGGNNAFREGGPTPGTPGRTGDGDGYLRGGSPGRRRSRRSLGRDDRTINVTGGEYVLNRRQVDEYPGGVAGLEAWRMSTLGRGGQQGPAQDPRRDEMMGQSASSGAAGGRGAQTYKQILAIAQRLVPGTRMTSGIRPGARTHASGSLSYHATGHAADLVGPSLFRIWSALNGSGTAWQELIYSGAPNYIGRGVRKPIGRLDPVTRADHWDHVHAALLAGGARGGLGIDFGALARKAINALWGPVSRGLRGIAGNNVLGDLIVGGGAKIKDAMLDWTGRQAGPGVAGGPGGGAPAANKALGQRLASAYGWGSGAQWSALNALVMGESGWSNTAQNPTSTAYGIGQFLNSTWASVGATKTSNPTAQINAMLKYIKQRYGSATAAYAFKRSHNWYREGGPVGPASAFRTGGPVGGIRTGGPVGRLPGFATGGKIPSVYGTTLSEFTGRKRRSPGQAPVVANAALAGELEKVFMARAALVAKAPSVQGNLAMRWYRKPVGVTPQQFYLNDVRDQNRGKTGYIQSSKGSWVKGTRHQIAWRTNLWNKYKSRGLSGRLQSYAPGRAPAVQTSGGLGARSVYRPQSANVPGSKPVGAVNIGNGAVQVSISGGSGGVDAEMVERVVTQAFAQFAGLIQVRSR